MKNWLVDAGIDAHIISQSANKQVSKIKLGKRLNLSAKAMLPGSSAGSLRPLLTKAAIKEYIISLLYF